MSNPSKEALETEKLRPIFDLDKSPFELHQKPTIVIYNDDGTIKEQTSL